MEGRKSMKVPQELWERLRRKAEREGRTMSDVLRSLLEQLAEEEESAQTIPKTCVFCGRETGAGRICEECFYDPEIVRPQIVGAVYYVWALNLREIDPKLPRDFDTFVRSLNKDAAEVYGLTEDEWVIFTEWYEFRKKFKRQEITIDDPEWRKFCVRAVKDGFVGPKASWRTMTYLFTFDVRKVIRRGTQEKGGV